MIGFGRKPQTLETSSKIRYVSLGSDPGILDWMGGIATTYWEIRRRLTTAVRQSKEDYDIIHFIYPEAAFYPKERSARVVSTAWGFSSPRETINDARQKFSGMKLGLGLIAELQFYYVDLAGFRVSDGVVCTTRESERFWQKRTGTPATYIPVPIELPPGYDREKLSEENTHYVTFLLAERDLERPRNNLWVVLQAFQLVHRRGFSNFQLYIVGGHGSTLRSYVTHLNESGIEVHLSSYLPRDQFFELLRTIDVCMIPRYIKDHGGYWALEAMARGIAVIASDVPAFSDFVMDGKNGLLVNPHSPDELSNKIQLVLEDASSLKKMKSEAQRFVRQFHALDVVGQKHLSFYERIGVAQ
jgi:glycosyltransferase involved in cell wall biosynthesis